MIIYQAKITEIGSEALSEESLVVLFQDNAPEDLRPYCVLHSGESLNGSLEVGAELRLGSYSYRITAIGKLAEKNLNDLGHVSLYFNDKSETENPGDINISGNSRPILQVGDSITIIK